MCSQNIIKLIINFLLLIEPPSPAISVISSTVQFTLTNDERDVVLKEEGEGYVNVTLNCSVSESSAHLRFQWVYRGASIEPSKNHTPHQLHLMGLSVGEVIGSVQCFVTDMNMTGVGYLRIVEGLYRRKQPLFVCVCSIITVYNSRTISSSYNLCRTQSIVFTMQQLYFATTGWFHCTKAESLYNNSFIISFSFSFRQM